VQRIMTYLDDKKRKGNGLKVSKYLIYFSMMSLLFISMLTSCVLHNPKKDKQAALALVDGQQWQQTKYIGAGFLLQSFAPGNIQPGQPLTVYIEGDGHAYISRKRPSNDPTPHNPVALKLALRHPDGQAMYLGRPCQYVQNEQCKVVYWTLGRYAKEVVDSYVEVLNQIKRKYSPSSVTLVGFSGGGTIATLVAARRNDISGIITVAANLDHVAWTSHHHVSPLIYSLNPKNYAQQLQHIPQVHYVGEKDTTVPMLVVTSYAEGMQVTTHMLIERIAKNGHGCCWEKNWTSLYLRARQFLDSH